ncbi:MAG TPA: ScpA family protein [Bauldia sp.]|nr:ScpA family protein [Bauldia sp.]
MTAAAPTSEQDQEKIWEAYAVLDRGASDSALVVDVDGFEGPLDLLLELARSQKVDIARISILALADQYLAYIEKIRSLRLELAADYLVMAAWLAYLKSRLLIPEVSDGEEPTGEELAAALAFRLQRLEAMRDAAARLANRDRLGRDIFSRGDPEPVAITRKNEYSATLHDLLAAYATQRQEKAIAVVTIGARAVWSLQDARHALTRLVGHVAEWTPMEVLMSPYLSSLGMRRSVTASAFGASLELVREGKLELRQTEPFAPLYVRDRTPLALVSSETGNG